MRAKRAKKAKKAKKMPHNIGKAIKKKKTFVRRKTKMETIQITTRKEQPMPVQLQHMKVEALARQDIPLQRVSSSWIKEIGYHAKEHLGVMTTLPRKNYPSRGYYISGMSMSAFQLFYYAHSKGTHFNYHIKDKYTITRYR